MQFSEFPGGCHLGVGIAAVESFDQGIDRARFPQVARGAGADGLVGERNFESGDHFGGALAAQGVAGVVALGDAGFAVHHGGDQQGDGGRGHCFASFVASANAARARAACLGSKFGFRASARSRCLREASRSPSARAIMPAW